MKKKIKKFIQDAKAAEVPKKVIIYSLVAKQGLKVREARQAYKKSFPCRKRHGVT